MENVVIFGDSSTVEFIHQIIQKAIQQDASDIHFEPHKEGYVIRMRIDGLLTKIVTPDHSEGLRMISCLKVLAQCDIAEKRLPQDGRFTFNERDIRLSTCPTLFGEKIVLRILENNPSRFNSDNLGFEEDQKLLFQNALESPHGMILVTGPTGSGKTITLYTALKELNLPECNIITIEDPVEIPIEGINQVNVNIKAGFHFANALRSFLRLDPDIIMVGEIRDIETAEMAFKAAQTGHKILSTLHTNRAVDAISRLMYMGIPAFHIATTLSCVIAQRLVRRLCDHCKKPIQDHFIAIGCQYCHQGYKGRIGIYEMLPISDNIRELILSGAHPLDLIQQMKKENVVFLENAAQIKIKKGLTSLNEIKQII